MKMEHVMRAPMDGTIDRVSFTVGQLVAENKVLVTFRDADK
jgi:acetyl/propionyl-CoA carboxylase alpha subunit